MHRRVLVPVLLTALVLAGCIVQTPAPMSSSATPVPTTLQPAVTPPATVSQSSPTPVSSTPTPQVAPTPQIISKPAELSMPRGVRDPDWAVEVYLPELVYPGTTIFADNHVADRPRIVEVNMLGEVVWEYFVPDNLKQFNNPGLDIEPLPSGNILFVLPRNGIYEIDRNGKVVWSFVDSKVSHDADRLPNGNTLFVYGAFDQMDDAQVREVDPSGNVVWSWYARDHFNRAPYNAISDEGWTHTNSVSRLANGNTLVSLRNFGVVAELDASGKVIRTIGEGLFEYQHDPEMQSNGNLLVANHSRPVQTVLEIDPATGKTVWSFAVPWQLVRDADRLSNGNTLITGHTVLLEVAADGTTVWRLRLNKEISRQDGSAKGFYKAIRIPVVSGN